MALAEIPLFYRTHWLTENSAAAWFSGLETPSERLDCRVCQMVKPKGLTRDLGPFRPDLKCCTFGPYLPAFTVGALLTETDHRSSDILERLDRHFERSRATPLGLFSKQESTSICETGKHVETRCPFLAGGTCTIWNFRPSPCAGYVCQSRAGAAGFKQWRQWEMRLAQFEWTLAHEVAFEMGRTMDEVDVEFTDRRAAKAYFRETFVRAKRMVSLIDNPNRAPQGPAHA